VRNEKFQKESGEIMAYKYESVLKSFEYSTESYKVISEFLLSGDKTNPNVLLNVTTISKHFNKRPNDWFANPSTIIFIKALIKIKGNDKQFIKAFKKWLKSDTRKSGITKKDDSTEIVENLENKEIVKLAKDIGMIEVKKALTKACDN